MNIAFLSTFFLTCTLINYAILLLWFGVFCCAHGWLFRLHSRWFHLSEERFDAIHYHTIALYKIGVLLLNLVPYLALRFMG